MTKVAVIYLDRKGNDPRFARIFLASLFRNRPGAAFDLIWQSKNYPAGRSNPEFERLRADIPVEVSEFRYPDDIYQFAMARDAARQIDHDMLLCFTSWSRVLAGNWLRHYLHAFDSVARCGVVGATGSYETIVDAPDFPNVHLRTNAFMIERKTLLRLDLGAMQSLFDGNLIEAGRNSMTRQITARGLTPVVIGCEGGCVLPEAWPTSRTFRSGRQERLLVADNRTSDYAVANRQTRLMLARLAWRDKAVLEYPSVIERLIARYKWRDPVWFEKPLAE